MPPNRYSKLDKQIVEGTAHRVISERNVYGDNTGSPPPPFMRFVVIEVIFDPTIVDDNKAAYFEHVIGVSNQQYAKVLPRNAIIAQQVIYGDANAPSQPMFLFPFFPPHLSLPCQPGEHVWAMFENAGGSISDLGYWFCRIVEPGFVEDVNHTHAPRSLDSGFVTTTKESFDGQVPPKYEFRNGMAMMTPDGARQTIAETAFMNEDEGVYERLMHNSDAGRTMTYEAVPRYRKRPADVTLEGCNNTLIVLGKDRVGPAAQFVSDDESKFAVVVPQEIPERGVGAIDIVAGRGQIPETAGSVVACSSINGEPTGQLELGKSTVELVPNEGDPDFLHDRSRVYVAQKTRVDTNFGLSSFNLAFGAGTIQGTSVRGSESDAYVGDEAGGDGAVVVRSDKVRLIARSDIEIVVTGVDSRDAEGRLVASSDVSGYASITIKANGDIVMKPSAKGYVKLGGDDADKGLLCTDQPVVAQEGLVQGPPLITTMGGQIGGSTGDGTALVTGQGRYAAKVLVK
jgi:hypothetical protein